MATFGELIHGRKPEVAPFLPTDPLEELKKLLSGEIGAFPQIEQLGGLFQKYMLNALGPEFQQSLKKIGVDTNAVLDRAGQFLTGELPPDVMSKVFRQSAFQNLGSGLLGSPAGTSSTARHVLQTSQDQILKGAGLLETGTNATQRWAQIMSGTIMSPSSQMYSPEWFSNFMATQNQLKTAQKQLQYNVNAAPDPAWADRAKLFANLTGAAAGSMGAGNSMNTYAQTFPTGSAGGQGAGGGGSSYGANVMSGFGGQQNFGNPQNTGIAQNPGFFTNFSNAWSSPDPNYQTQGFGGNLGGYLGGIFNAGG